MIFPKKRKRKKKVNEEQGKSSKWQTNFFVHTLGEKKIMQIFPDSKEVNKTLYSSFFKRGYIDLIWFPFKEETSHSATLSVI